MGLVTARFSMDRRVAVCPVANDADNLTFDESANAQPRDATSKPVRPAGIKETFVGVGPAAPQPSATSSVAPLKTTVIGAGSVTPQPQSSGSLKATLLGAMPNAAMVPSHPEPSATAAPPTKRDSGSIKSTLLGAAPSMAMAPRRLAPPTDAPTLSDSGLFHSEAPELAPDSVFAKAFRIACVTTRGRSSVLYDATLLGVAKRHALKVFRRSPGVDEQALQRFVHDARVGSRVESEHLVEVARAGYDGASECAWVASEFLEGETLATRMAALEEGEVLPVADAWRVLTGVCRGLAKAHQQGVVHGDLRPSNIYLARSGSEGFDVKLLDFGVVHLLPAWRDRESEFASWRAPEVPSAEITPAADVWSVGLLAFLLFTGHEYWASAPSADHSARRITPASDRATLLNCAARLPRGFDAWFAQCVSRLPASRFKSAGELVPALAALQSSSDVPVLDYTPARAANAIVQPHVARKVTTRPSAAPPSRSDDEERPSRPSFAPSPAPMPRRAQRSPIQAPVMPDADAPRQRAATPTPTPTSNTQNVMIPQGPLKAAALQNATPLHGSPRGTYAQPQGSRTAHPSPSQGLSPPQGMPDARMTTRPSPARPMSPPMGVAVHTTPMSSPSALTSTGSQRALTNSGAQRALTNSGAQRVLALDAASSALANARPIAESFELAPHRPSTRPPVAMPAPALAASPRMSQRTVYLLAAAAGALSFSLVGLVVARQQRASETTLESTPALQTPPAEPVIGPAPTPRVTPARRWSGSLVAGESRWSFVLALRVNDRAVTGWFSWTAAQVPGTREGEQVRENVEGAFDPATGAIELHGTASTNPNLLPVNAYRLRVTADGALAGSTLDPNERIEGAPAR